MQLHTTKMSERTWEFTQFEAEPMQAKVVTGFYVADSVYEKT